MLFFFFIFLFFFFFFFFIVFFFFFFFFQAEDGIRDHCVTGVQTCALPISNCCQRIRPVAHYGDCVPRRKSNPIALRSDQACERTAGRGLTRPTFVRVFTFDGRARHSVSATPGEYASTRFGGTRFSFVSWHSLFLSSAHELARPQKAAACNSAMGGRGQLVLHHHQMRAAGKESIMPRRHWRGGARSHEVQPREVCLALSSLPAHAGSFARGPRFPARAGNGNGDQELEKVCR